MRELKLTAKEIKTLLQNIQDDIYHVTEFCVLDDVNKEELKHLKNIESKLVAMLYLAQ